MTIAMIVGPASRRPIRTLVDPRRAARQSNAALVCQAIWSRVSPTNTCVIGTSPRSKSPKSWATTLTTRDHPISTWPKSTVNNGPPNRSRTRGKPRPLGVPGTPLCWNRHPALPRAPHNGATGLPRGARRILVLPATRKAAGAPSAWSQPPQSTHARPRRWCDAGSPGRQCVTAAQKAGDEDTVRNNDSNRDRGRIRIRTRTLNRHATVDSQDGCRYTIPNARGVAIGFQPVDDSDRIRDSH